MARKTAWIQQTNKFFYKLLLEIAVTYNANFDRELFTSILLLGLSPTVGPQSHRTRKLKWDFIRDDRPAYNLLCFIFGRLDCLERVPTDRGGHAKDIQIFCIRILLIGTSAFLMLGITQLARSYKLLEIKNSLLEPSNEEEMAKKPCRWSRAGQLQSLNRDRKELGDILYRQ